MKAIMRILTETWLYAPKKAHYRLLAGGSLNLTGWDFKHCPIVEKDDQLIQHSDLAIVPKLIPFLVLLKCVPNLSF